VHALLAATGQAGGIFNIGTGRETSVLELHTLCAKAAGVDAAPRFEGPRLGDARRSVLDVSRAVDVLGWRPQMPLEEGLRLTWSWLTQD